MKLDKVAWIILVIIVCATGCTATRSYSIRHVPSSDEVTEAYANKHHLETRPHDAIVVATDAGNSYKDRVYVQNENGKNIDTIDNGGISTWARFWSSGGGLLTGVPAAAVLGWSNYKAAGRQSDTVITTGEGGKAAAGAQTGAGTIDIDQ